MNISIVSLTCIYVGAMSGVLVSSLLFSGNGVTPINIGMMIGYTFLYCLSVIVSMLESK